MKNEIRVTAPLGISTINPPTGANLTAATDEVINAALDTDAGPGEPASFHNLRGRLEAVREKFPPLYQESFVTPYIQVLDRLGEGKYLSILMRDPQREGAGGLLLDMAQAVLQRGEGFAALATDAFQEVVSDLYDGFLSAEDRRGVNPPDEGVVPPLVKWGNPDAGPYTWPVDATRSFSAGAGVVSLPPAHVRHGLLAWAALGHETAGHDILGADTGLRDQLAQAVQRALSDLDTGLAEYWSQRIDETASDVMGILNMGPAAGIGLVGYFRGLNAAFGAGRTLRNVGPASDPHPADIVRGYLAAETVRQLKFTGHTKWADLISAETEKDVRGIVLDGVKIDKARAKKSAEIVARTLVGFKAPALEQHALGEIQNWRDADERQVKRVRNALRTAVPLSRSDLTDIYAAHVVAAGVVEALESPATLATTFARMLSTLKAMHDVNPSWGPLHVHNPGNLRRDLAYIPSPPEAEAEEAAVVEPRARNTVRAGKNGKGSSQVQTS